MVSTVVLHCILVTYLCILIYYIYFKAGKPFMQPQYDMGMKWWTGSIFVSHTVLSKWSSCSLNSHQLKALLSTYTSIH